LDKKELILGFIKQDLSIMLLEEFPKDEYKKRKQNYFLEKHKKSGHKMVSNLVIASTAISHMIKIGKITTQNQLESILSLPYFRTYIKNQEPPRQELNLKIAETPSIDLSDMSQLETKARLHDWALRKAKEEAMIQFEDLKQSKEADFLEMIEEKQTEYNSLPSILDISDIKEPTVSVENDSEYDHYEPWWKQLHMISDPFPTLEGLSQIPAEFHETVLHKTDIFNRYQTVIDEVPEEILKNTIFFGEFGSGKTTLFEFLIKQFWSVDIPAIYLQIFTQEKIDSVMKRFKHELCRELRELLFQQLDVVDEIPSSTNIDDEIRSILNVYCNSKSPLGLVIFIDDLHKNTTYTHTSLDFLSYLQIFTARLNRAVGSLRISFYVAGALEWQSIVSKEPKFSGSFPNREIIRDISVEDAYKMLNIRLKPFWPNPEVNREVKREFIEQEYSFLLNNGVPLTYRSFIHRVREKFREGEFDILTSDPVTFQYDTLQNIQAILEGDSRLKKKLKILFGNVTAKLNRKAALEQLIHVFLRGSIEDIDPLLKEYHYHYQQLKKAQLIMKRKKKDGGFSWVICPEILKRNKEIIRIYQVSLESYLIPVYGLATRRRATADEEIDLIDEIIDTHQNKELKHQMEIIKELHLKIAREQRAFRSEFSVDELVGLCTTNLENLSRTYFTHVDPIELVLDPIAQWARYWYFPSETQQFIKLVNNTELSEKQIWPVINMYRQTFAVILSFIVKQIHQSAIFPIVSLDLTKTESQRLRNIYSYWIEGRFSKSAKALNKILKVQLSKHLYNYFTLCYGNLEDRLDHIPREIRTKITENLPVGEQVRGFNEFKRFGLKDISSIISGEGDAISNESWLNMFSIVMQNRKGEDVSNLLHAISRSQYEHIDKGYSADKLRNLIWDAVLLLQDMNRGYPTLASEGISYEKKNDKILVSISFNPDIKTNQNLVEIDKRICEDLRNSLTGNLLPLDDLRFIETTSDTDYRTFFAFLGLGLKDVLSDFFDISWKLMVSHIRGPNLAVRVEETLHANLVELANQLINRLSSLRSGLEDWRAFEDVGIEILSLLFSPHLIVPPVVQSYTEDKRERRDAIYRLASSGNVIWDQIRHDFATMFLLVEFKNSSYSPEPGDVAQIGNYLFRQAKRAFGILCSHVPAEDAAIARRAKLWKEEEKLVLLLSKSDLIQMLQMKSEGGNPSEFIMDRISIFLRNLSV